MTTPNVTELVRNGNPVGERPANGQTATAPAQNHSH